MLHVIAVIDQLDGVGIDAIVTPLEPSLAALPVASRCMS